MDAEGGSEKKPCPYFEVTSKEIWGTMDGEPLYQRYEGAICMARIMRVMFPMVKVGGGVEFNYNRVGCDMVHSDGEKVPDFWDAEKKCWFYPAK
jgi:hypothetical protein